MELTQENLANLIKLAYYLESLPEDYAHFDMHNYFDLHTTKLSGYPLTLNHLEQYKYIKKQRTLQKCGAVACALGHGIAAGVAPPTYPYKHIEDVNIRIFWDDYEKLFTNDNKLIYDFVFSSIWGEVDNHHYGAAARIRFLLAGHFDDYCERYKFSILLFPPELYNSCRRGKKWKSDEATSNRLYLM